VSGSLAGVVTAISLSRATMRYLRQNLFFALAYNAIGIPVAAGILYPFSGIRLSPVIAAVAMALSSLSVVGNANWPSGVNAAFVLLSSLSPGSGGTASRPRGRAPGAGALPACSVTADPLPAVPARSFIRRGCLVHVVLAAGGGIHAVRLRPGAGTLHMIGICGYRPCG
jgi:hypothetical protein